MISDRQLYTIKLSYKAVRMEAESGIAISSMNVVTEIKPGQFVFEDDYKKCPNNCSISSN